ncbi:MAG: hypothetical protein KC609_01960 [Myxococcales bacterium]|nr:hypothetical protein [Myxococcales bacterium]
MADKEKNFKRINFFRGFLTTEKDWNDAEHYHVEKRKLHNRMLHGPGIVPHFADGLAVNQRARGELALEILPGYGVDGQGNDIFLWEPEIITINPADFKLPQTLYVVLKYVEEFTDFIAYKQNLDYKGHRRIAEKAKVELQIVEPDIKSEVELARVYLEKGAKRITAAKNPLEPRSNEIDLRYRPIAGIVGSTLDQNTLWQLRDLTQFCRETYSYLAHDVEILRAFDVLHSFVNFEMSLLMNMIDMRNIFLLYELIFELQWEMIIDVETSLPEFASKKEFLNYKKNIEILRGMFLERNFNRELLINIIGYQTKACEALQGLFAHKLRKARKGKEDVAVTALDDILEKVKVRSTDFGKELVVDNQKFTLVDFIDLLDKNSEDAHRFQVNNARDSYRTRQRLKYPDGVVVEDVGLAYEGGYAEWQVRNVTPGVDLIMLVRMDYVHGDAEAEIQVNNRRVGNMRIPGEDRQFRWRNWPFVIKGEFIEDKILHIKQIPLTADRDLNMFKIWFYQPVK